MFGARKCARKLASQVVELQTQRDKAQGRLEKIGSMASELVAEVKKLREERETTRKRLETLSSYSVLQLETRRAELETEVAELEARFSKEKVEAESALELIKQQAKKARQSIVETEDLELLQEVGIYQYRHPLTDAVAYEKALAELQAKIKAMAKKDGGAVLASSDWTVNGSAREGRAMVREYSKLMLRAFNAEADTLIRWLKPYKLDRALERLRKTAETIARLGRTMNIRISTEYYQLRAQELELTADFLQKEAEQKEVEREERERLREERRVQKEIEAERSRLEKERQHHANALQALLDKGDEAGAARLHEQLSEVERAIEDMDYRAANIRAGYVYVISNIGSFGEKMVKIGLTRRLDPMERVRELGDASVPFKFDVHALFFSKDAVGIEKAMHDRLSGLRVNLINQRREFFRATPLEIKTHLSELAGELLEFNEIPDAFEYRQSIRAQGETSKLSQ